MCSFEGCNDPARSKGLCTGHYTQQWKGEELRPKRESKTNTNPCRITDCNNIHTAKGLCKRHYWLSHVFNASDLMLEQMKTCEACGSNEYLVFDHDHSCCNGNFSCGKCIRGVLCRSCNTAFGALEDSLERVIQLEGYARARVRKNFSNLD